mmetsp:Transcript_13797/g.40323  ORF Transcript_13797/g.40323 Transcript_13797/m.40323 type:complete len:304 (+) Transcript_13797:6972-7883(+)
MLEAERAALTMGRRTFGPPIHCTLSAKQFGDTMLPTPYTKASVETNSLLELILATFTNRREKCALPLSEELSLVLPLVADAWKPQIMLSAATLQSNPTAVRRSDSGPAIGPPPNPLSRITWPAASTSGTPRRLNAPATLPCSPLSASIANVAVAVAASERRCGLSPQNIPWKSGPAANIEVASRVPRITERNKVGPSSHAGKDPRTIPLLARTGLGTPICTLAVGGKTILSILTSDSRGRPSTHMPRIDFRDSTARFGGWNVRKTWCQTPLTKGDTGKEVGSFREEDERTLNLWLWRSYHTDK